MAALLCICAGCAQKQVNPQAAAARPAPKPAQGQDVVEAARQHIGVPYRFGGRSPETGFDCSGLVCWTYEQVGVKLPRRAREQVAFGAPVASRADLKPGDIVAFKGTRSRTGWHSGIYTGNGKFIHSPNKGKTVMESSLDEDYFARRYYGACRIPRDGSAEELYIAYQKQLSEQANAARAARTAGKGAKAVAAKGKAKAGTNQTVASAAKGKSAKAPAAKQKNANAKAPAPKTDKSAKAPAKAPAPAKKPPAATTADKSLPPGRTAADKS